MSSVILVVTIQGDSIEEESAIAKIISEGLVDRGFPNVEISASEVLYREGNVVDHKGNLLDKSIPIVTTNQSIH